MKAGPAWALVVESGVDGTAFGPVLPSEASMCLACFHARRQASGAVVGSVALHPVSGPYLAKLGSTRLSGHQIHPQDGAQLFLPPGRCAGRCAFADTILARGPLPVEACIGSRLGLIRRIEVLGVIHGFHTAIAYGASTPASAGVQVAFGGIASAASRDLACRLAVFEALERYAAAFWAPSQILVQPGKRGAWVEVNLPEGGTALVAAERVFMPFPNADGQLCGTSEGLACGACIDDARNRAVAELVERHILRDLFALADGMQCPMRSGGGEATVMIPAAGHVIAVHAIWSAQPPYLTVGFGCAREILDAREHARRERLTILAHRMLAEGGHWGHATIPESKFDQRLRRMAIDPACAGAFLGALDCADEGAFPITPLGAVGWIDVTPPDVKIFGVAVVRAVAVACPKQDAT